MRGHADGRTRLERIADPFGFLSELLAHARLAVRLGEGGEWLLLDPAALRLDAVAAVKEVERLLAGARPLPNAAAVPALGSDEDGILQELTRDRRGGLRSVEFGAGAAAAAGVRSETGIARASWPTHIGRAAARRASGSIRPLAHAGRVRAQAALRSLSEALSRQSRLQSAVFDNMAEGVIMVDEHGEVALWNHAAESILQMPAPDLDYGLGYGEWLSRVSVFSPNALTPLAPDQTPMARALRGQTVDDAQVCVCHDGLPEGVWVSVNARPLADPSVRLRGAVAVFRDVTAERAAREAKDRAQHDVRRVIESSPEGIAIVRDDRWIFCNRAMARALGYATPDALVGRHRRQIVHPDDWSRVANRTREAQMQQRGTEPSATEHEVRYLRASGDYAVMEVSLAQLTEFDGAPAVLVMARDVTERKKLQAQLRMSERLVAVGTLAAGVAHEINSPLAAVLGNIEWLSGRLDRLLHEVAAADAGSAREPGAALDDALRALVGPVREAREAAGRVRQIVHDLKLFSRAEEELLDPVDLTRVLDSATRMAWHEIRHRARLVEDYRDLPPAFGNEARLCQVFLNLLINAAQSIPEGQADKHAIRLSAREERGQLVVEVRDSGVGIAKDVLGRIFDPFFTTKPPGVGTGLGLSICHRIVSDYGGYIDVESEPGHGALFRVVLQVAQRSAIEPTQTQAQAVDPGRRGRVLVLDDDPSILATLRLILSEWHEVTALADGREALRRLRAGEHYDVIVCDVMMPQMTAMDFHAELSREQPDAAAQIVFLTGGAFTLAAREFLDRVDNVRFDKPFDTQQLVSLVHERIAKQPAMRCKE